MTIRVNLTSISVDDQDAALAFYRDKVGFTVKHDIDMGGGARWLTLVPPTEPDGAQLLLEPNAKYPAMAALKSALFADGIPFTQLDVRDLDGHFARMTDLGVTFTGPVAEMGGVKMAIFDDTCGNLIALVEELNG